MLMPKLNTVFYFIISAALDKRFPPITVGAGVGPFPPPLSLSFSPIICETRAHRAPGRHLVLLVPWRNPLTGSATGEGNSDKDKNR